MAHYLFLQLICARSQLYLSGEVYGSDGSLSEDRAEDRTPEQWQSQLQTWSSRLIPHRLQRGDKLHPGVRFEPPLLRLCELKRPHPEDVLALNFWALTYRLNLRAYLESLS